MRWDSRVAIRVTGVVAAIVFSFLLAIDGR